MASNYTYSNKHNMLSNFSVYRTGLSNFSVWLVVDVYYNSGSIFFLINAWSRSFWLMVSRILYDGYTNLLVFLEKRHIDVNRLGTVE